MIANLGTTLPFALRVAAGLFAALALGLPAAAEETPKHGGILSYMIPADAPPSFDAHREVTYATIHSAAPFYSTLIRINPLNPGSTTDFVCDLCTEMPTPTDGGKTYTFKIREGVKFHDGSPLTAADVAASWQEILDKDPRWFEKNIMGSGPFKFAGSEIGQSIKGVRNPDYYHQGQPYLD